MGRFSRAGLAVAIVLIGMLLHPAAHAAGATHTSGAAHASGAEHTTHAAQAGTVTEYGEWETTDKTGTVTAPGSYFPAGHVTSDAGIFRVFSGKSTYLTGDTPFGQEFGSSKDHSYLQFNAVSAAKPSTTTITFATPAPANSWGFALGDIDADKATIEATDANGNALTAAELGWKGAFNYCEPSPRPSSCAHPPFTDKPDWDPVTATLTGHGPDTNGASGWFMPAKAVKSLTIKYSVLTGRPVGQLWIAAKWAQRKPDIAIDKTAYPTHVLPGGTVTFKITVRNEGGAAEPLASFHDNLSDVLDDADYLHDAHASGGTVSYAKPVLSWQGAVPPHQTRTITYSVRIHKQVRGNGRIRNVVIAEGHRTLCQDKGCGVTVHIAITVPCRAAIPAAPAASAAPAARTAPATSAGLARSTRYAC